MSRHGLRSTHRPRSLRDLEACLAARLSKLYHSSFRAPVRRATLANANERRNWRIYADFSQRLIAQARRLYADERFASELDETTYALCLSILPWASFRQTRAAVKTHTSLDLRGPIPSSISPRESSMTCACSIFLHESRAQPMSSTVLT